MSDTGNTKAGNERRIPFSKIVDGFRLPGRFSEEAFKSALAYKPRPDDLFIVTFPKCGTTWVQNIVACIFKNGEPFENFLDFLTQAPFLEMTGAKAAETMKRPGAIKVHLPFYLTPWSPDAKYIFIARNPKDCCVSFYHHTKNVKQLKFDGGSFDDFFELFIEGNTDFGDYFDSVMSWYEHRNEPNVLFITYEELKKNTELIVLKIAEFIGSQYKEALENNKKLLEDVILHSSFSYLKENINKQMAGVVNFPRDKIQDNPDLTESLKEFISRKNNGNKKDISRILFLRKGEVGDWANYFSPQQNERMYKKFQKRMGGTELEELWKDIMDIKQN